MNIKTSHVEIADPNIYILLVCLSMAWLANPIRVLHPYVRDELNAKDSIMQMDTVLE